MNKRINRGTLVKNLSTILAIFIIGLSIIDDYGMSWDEEIEIRMVKWNYEYITQGQEIPKNLKHYGFIFNFTSEVAYQVTNKVANIFDGHLSLNQEKVQEISAAPKYYKRVKVKHILTFLISMITYFSVAGIVGILVGIRFAWLGPITLALFPRFWGHSFFNPKDIPFAALFTLSTFLGAYLINFYLSTEAHEVKIKNFKLSRFTLLYGSLIGITTGTRVGGFLVMGFVFLTHLLVNIFHQNKARDFLLFWNQYLLMGISWMITTALIHPASWGNPIGWFFETVAYLSDHAWDEKVLFEGHWLEVQSLPWYYLPTFLKITIPIVFQLLFFTGLFLLLTRFRRMTSLQQACIVLVSFQIFFLPLLAIIKDSTMYDGMRQFLFILPGIAAISAVALALTYQMLSNNLSQGIFISLFIGVFSLIVIDMAKLHPYEYIYFNSTVGGLQGADAKYETDYWGLSLREGMEWINENSASVKDVVVTNLSATTFAWPTLNITYLRDFEENEIRSKFYYIAPPRFNYQKKFSSCDVVHKVVRKEVDLSIVKKCR